MKRLSLIGRTLLGAFLALALATTSYGQTTVQTADVPKTISYQGLISTPDGGAIADGSYEITVTIYGDAEGKSVVWRNSYTTDVRGGLFNLYLGGADAPLPGAGALNRPLWVGTQVAGSGELRPLTPLSASPYALNVADKAVTAEKLAAGAVTAEKVDMDYVSEIRIDGEKVTGKGTVLNLESDENISLKYDAVTGSVKIGSATAATGTHDHEKGASLQGAMDAWGGQGDQLDPGTHNPVLPAPGDWLGTSNNVIMEIKTFNTTAMRYEPSAGATPNVVGGNIANTIVAATSNGSVIDGGGAGGLTANFINGDFDAIGGGDQNSIGTASTVFDYSTIGGGQSNVVNSDWVTVSGGQGHIVNADHGTVGGGFDHTIGAVANNGTVAGGWINAVNNINGTVGGGTNNTVNGDFGTISGGQGNNANTMGATVGGGSANNINAPADHGTIGGGTGNTVNGDFATIGGGNGNSAIAVEATVGGGNGNNAATLGATIGGGQGNNINLPGDHGTVGGGMGNNVTGLHGTIGGGLNNHVAVDGGTVAGGQDNHTHNMFNAVGGGRNNHINADYGTISGGQDNHIAPTGVNGTIGGGQINMMDGDHATIGGGMGNTVMPMGTFGTIGGGMGNHLDAGRGTIGGGEANHMIGASSFSVIGGGQANHIDVDHATIGGGEANNIIAGGSRGTIGGGLANHVDVTRGTIGGGEANQVVAGGMYGTVGGGWANLVDAQNGTVGGGEGNRVTAAPYGTIPGGDNLNVTGSYAQTAVGFFNAPRGAVPIRPAPAGLTDDPLFMVGNGDFAGGTPVPTNAFEVSYNGHSIVYDVNGSGGASGPPRTAYRGGTYIDNIIYAWADVPDATGVPIGNMVVPNCDFGVTSIVKFAVGVYDVTINVSDPVTGLPITLNCGSITATIADDLAGSNGCAIVTTTSLGMPGPNMFRIRTYTAGGCTPDDLPFMFKVTGRP